MEFDGMVTFFFFFKSEHICDVKYTSYIRDGGTKTFTATDKPYGHSVTSLLCFSNDSLLSDTWFRVPIVLTASPLWILSEAQI